MADPKWFNGLFNAVIGGEWKSAKSYYLKDGTWLATTPYARGLGDEVVEPPPEGDYTMKVGEYKVGNDLRGYDPYVDPAWVDPGDLTPDTIGGLSVWRFNSNSTRTLLRLTGGTIGNPESLKVVFSGAEEYPLTQIDAENWQSTDNALYLKFRADNITFKMDVNGDVVEPPPVEEGPPVSNPGGYPVTEPDLMGRSDILYFIDFNDQSQTQDWVPSNRPGWDWDGSTSALGSGSLAAVMPANSNQPDDIKKDFEECEEAYMRWYRYYPPGFDFTSASFKSNGMYGRLEDSPADQPPTGYDKMSLRISHRNTTGNIMLYSYNLDQPDNSGQGFDLNLAPQQTPATGRWQKYEIRVKANSVGPGPVANPDGVIALYLDDVLVAYYDNMKFRLTTDLKWNQMDLSCYQAATSPSARYVWNDQVVCATGKIDQ